ncbi:MAG: ABC transporter permease [Bacteroidetes bacterium]|nr:MAG: ABC transporter permease [Bacteroidota bacterium]
MINSSSFYLAMRFLTGKKKFLFNKNILGAVLGIGLSLIPLIVVLEISSGMIEGITKRYMEIGSYHLQVKSYNNIDKIIEKSIVEKINTIYGVKSVFPVTTGIGLAYSENGRTGISFKALPENYFSIDTSAKQYIKIENGEFKLDTRDSAMLSFEVSRILDVIPGDRIKILTAKQVPGRRPVLKPSYLTVRGIFSTGYYELDALSIYINIDKGKSLFSDKGSNFIAVKLDDPFDNIEGKTKEVRERLGTGFIVYNWYDLERTMIDSFNTTKSILLFIMIIIVLVAAMNISSAVVMLVLEQEESIAMLMSTGVLSSVITRAFIYVGFIIGLFGTISGLLLGMAISVNINIIINLLESFINWGYIILQYIISPFYLLNDKNLIIVDTSYYLEQIPIKLDLYSILFISISTILLSVGAAFIPAMRAGKLKPMEILRKH